MRHPAIPRPLHLAITAALAWALLGQRCQRQPDEQAAHCQRALVAHVTTAAAAALAVAVAASTRDKLDRTRFVLFSCVCTSFSLSFRLLSSLFSGSLTAPRCNFYCTLKPECAKLMQRTMKSIVPAVAIEAKLKMTKTATTMTTMIITQNLSAILA